jgi:hypothetical protein
LIRAAVRPHLEPHPLPGLKASSFDPGSESVRNEISFDALNFVLADAAKRAAPAR